MVMVVLPEQKKAGWRVPKALSQHLRRNETPNVISFTQAANCTSLLLILRSSIVLSIHPARTLLALHSPLYL